jgi:cytochrome c2
MLNDLQRVRSLARAARWLLASLLILATGTAGAASLTFRIDGKPVKELSEEALLKALPLKTLATENPTTGQATAYQGVDLAELLELGFGEQWQRYDLVKFVSRDGYQPLIAQEAIAAHKGLVAVREEGRTGFSPFRRSQGETVDPGPFWLVWDTVGDPAAKTDGWLSWPWQLTTIELTRLDREFPRTAPPLGASEDANRGFTAFLQHCVKCHQVNGDGGDLGPELNYPASVTEYWQPDWLAKFIADPQSVRHHSKMVGFYAGTQNRAALVKDIVSYLKAMAQHKIEPKR